MANLLKEEPYLVNGGEIKDGVNQGSELYCLSCHSSLSKSERKEAKNLNRWFFMHHKIDSFDKKVDESERRKNN